LLISSSSFHNIADNYSVFAQPGSVIGLFITAYPTFNQIIFSPTSLALFYAFQLFIAADHPETEKNSTTAELPVQGRNMIFSNISEYDPILKRVIIPS
jgi:hypothetical protein